MQAGRTTAGHVAVAQRLDLFDSVRLGEHVKVHEDVVQALDLARAGIRSVSFASMTLRSLPSEAARTRNCGVTVAEKAVNPAMSAKMMVTFWCSRTSSRRMPLTSRNMSESLSSSTSLRANQARTYGDQVAARENARLDGDSGAGPYLRGRIE